MFILHTRLESLNDAFQCEDHEEMEQSLKSRLMITRITRKKLRRVAANSQFDYELFLNPLIRASCTSIRFKN
jgi:hypothetical protein